MEALPQNVKFIDKSVSWPSRKFLPSRPPTALYYFRKFKRPNPWVDWMEHVVTILAMNNSESVLLSESVDALEVNLYQSKLKIHIPCHKLEDVSGSQLSFVDVDVRIIMEMFVSKHLYNETMLGSICTFRSQ
jgi:hypothetical protein